MGLKKHTCIQVSFRKVVVLRKASYLRGTRIATLWVVGRWLKLYTLTARSSTCVKGTKMTVGMEILQKTITAGKWTTNEIYIQIRIPFEQKYFPAVLTMRVHKPDFWNLPVHPFDKTQIIAFNRSHLPWFQVEPFNMCDLTWWEPIDMTVFPRSFSVWDDQKSGVSSSLNSFPLELPHSTINNFWCQ